MTTEVLEVIKTRDTDEILKNEELATIGGMMVRAAKICEIQLKSDCVHVSLLVHDVVFNKIKDDKEFIVESNGWFNTLSDETVTVKRINGEVIKPVRLF